MIAFLMASRIPHFSGKRVGRVPRDLIIPLLFGGGVLLLLLAIYPMEILIALSLAYLALIPFGLRRYNALARQEESKVAPARVNSPQLQGAAGADIVDQEQQKQGGPGASANRPAPRTRKKCGSEFWAPGAGGGFPQWNCNCANCRAVRAGAPGFSARTQSSLAVSANGRDWALLNASPDLRQQIAASPALAPRERTACAPARSRRSCVTNGDVDHVAGLLNLREAQPFTRLWRAPRARRARRQ